MELLRWLKAKNQHLLFVDAGCDWLMANVVFHNRLSFAQGQIGIHCPKPADAVDFPFKSKGANKTAHSRRNPDSASDELVRIAACRTSSVWLNRNLQCRSRLIDDMIDFHSFVRYIAVQSSLSLGRTEFKITNVARIADSTAC